MTLSHCPWAELAPESTPGLPQLSGCSGHPSCSSSDPAKQKRYKTSRRWAGTATMRPAPCGAAWRGPQGSCWAGHKLCLLAEKGPPLHQGHPLTHEGRRYHPAPLRRPVPAAVFPPSSPLAALRGPEAALGLGRVLWPPCCTSSPLKTALGPRKSRTEGLHRTLCVPPACSVLQRGCLGAQRAGQSTGRLGQASPRRAGDLPHTNLLEVLVCPDG